MTEYIQPIEGSDASPMVNNRGHDGATSDSSADIPGLYVVDSAGGAEGLAAALRLPDEAQVPVPPASSQSASLPMPPAQANSGLGERMKAGVTGWLQKAATAAVGWAMTPDSYPQTPTMLGLGEPNAFYWPLFGDTLMRHEVSANTDEPASAALHEPEPGQTPRNEPVTESPEVIHQEVSTTAAHSPDPATGESQFAASPPLIASLRPTVVPAAPTAKPAPAVFQHANAAQGSPNADAGITRSATADLLAAETLLSAAEAAYIAITAADRNGEAQPEALRLAQNGGRLARLLAPLLAPLTQERRGQADLWRRKAEEDYRHALREVVRHKALAGGSLVEANDYIQMQLVNFEDAVTAKRIETAQQARGPFIFVERLLAREVWMTQTASAIGHIALGATVGMVSVALFGDADALRLSATAAASGAVGAVSGMLMARRANRLHIMTESGRQLAADLAAEHRSIVKRVAGQRTQIDAVAAIQGATKDIQARNQEHVRFSAFIGALATAGGVFSGDMLGIVLRNNLGQVSLQPQNHAAAVSPVHHGAAASPTAHAVASPTPHAAPRPTVTPTPHPTQPAGHMTPPKPIHHQQPEMPVQPGHHVQTNPNDLPWNNALKIAKAKHLKNPWQPIHQTINWLNAHKPGHHYALTKFPDGSLRLTDNGAQLGHQAQTVFNNAMSQVAA